MIENIKFGTDGWRAIIAKDFTVENLKRVTIATALWIKENSLPNKVVVGFDCRFGGKMFSEVVTQVFASQGIYVYLSKDFVSTPMVSLATQKLGCACGIVLTASHNPPSYNGYKIKGAYGGPALPKTIDEVEAFIPETTNLHLEDFDLILAQNKAEYSDFETMYVDHAKNCFDLEAIYKSGIRIGYDAMFGAGQNAVKRILPEATMLHAEFNPSFNGTAPEPIMKNLTEISQLIQTQKNIDIAFATDGDADRIGLINSKGEFVDSHHIILILVQYLNKHKGMTGKVVNSFSCTSKIKVLCDALGLDNIVTKIGFKYICGYMIDEQVLVGGEESGGIAVAGHIPERDGVWIALTIIEYMAKTGKTLDQLIEEVYSVTGSFAMERYDLHVNEDLKQSIIADAKTDKYTHFGNYKIVGKEDIDGFKFIFENGSWVMLRASGTEPVLRVYSEAANYAEAVNILEATKNQLIP